MLRLFGTAYGQDGGKYEGFEFGDGNVSVNDILLQIEPKAAKEYGIALRKIIVADPPETGGVGMTPSTVRGTMMSPVKMASRALVTRTSVIVGPTDTAIASPTRFRGFSVSCRSR